MTNNEAKMTEREKLPYPLSLTNKERGDREGDLIQDKRREQKRKEGGRNRRQIGEQQLAWLGS